MSLEKQAPLEKHKKYLRSYKPNDFYWGVGIEEETYLEISGNFQVTGSFMIDNHREERYSVDYFKNYKPYYFKNLMKTKYNPFKTYPLPLLINSHSFIHTDRNGNHRTTYERRPILNPKFSGKTLFEEIQLKDSYFKHEYEKSFLFDGDTIEFATQKFYKATIEDAIEELVKTRANFLKHLNNAFKKLEFFPDNNIVYPSANYSFAHYITNRKNLGIFNNGTYNINLTIPNYLNEHGEIKDFTLFKDQHSKAIKLIQWIEPLLLIHYGSPDPCAESGSQKYLFSKASQRCAVSRYIGIGTFDADEMPSGKVLQRPADTFHVKKHGWYKKFYFHNAYTPQKEMGFDINFNKHKNHGIEIRFFDNFHTDRLLPLLQLLVNILDYAISKKKVLNPIYCTEWNNFVSDSMRFGKDLILTQDIISMYEKIFNVRFSVIDTTAEAILNSLKDQLFVPNGLCSTHMFRQKYCCA